MNVSGAEARPAVLCLVSTVVLGETGPEGLLTWPAGWGWGSSALSASQEPGTVPGSPLESKSGIAPHFA